MATNKITTILSLFQYYVIRVLYFPKNYVTEILTKMCTVLKSNFGASLRTLPLAATRVPLGWSWLHKTLVFVGGSVVLVPRFKTIKIIYPSTGKPWSAATA